MKIIFILFTLGLILLWAYPIEAQEIVVTASPIESNDANSTILEKGFVQKNVTRDLGDLLNDLPGINLSRQGPGGQSSLILRGENSNHLLLMIDGVEVTDPTTPQNTFDPSYWTMTGVEKVEVIRGNQSARFGARASAGVINLITTQRNSRTGGDVMLSHEMGSNHTLKDMLAYSLNRAHWSFFLGGDTKKSEGISLANADRGNSEKDPFD
ncbi:MAG: TonB-dependent receptor plug domain-containing protein, partial [Pseudomonadota bacterium]